MTDAKLLDDRYNVGFRYSFRVTSNEKIIKEHRKSLKKRTPL